MDLNFFVHLHRVCLNTLKYLSPHLKKKQNIFFISQQSESFFKKMNIQVVKTVGHFKGLFALMAFAIHFEYALQFYFCNTSPLTNACHLKRGLKFTYAKN
jgi:hypothetical protein